MKKIIKKQTTIKAYCYKGYPARLLAGLLLTTLWVALIPLLYLGGTRVMWLLPLVAGIISPLISGGLCILIRRLLFLKNIEVTFQEDSGGIIVGKKTHTIMYREVKEVAYKNLAGGRLRLYIEERDTALLFVETLRKGDAGTLLFDIGRGFIDGKQKGGWKDYDEKHI